MATGVTSWPLHCYPQDMRTTTAYDYDYSTRTVLAVHPPALTRAVHPPALTRTILDVHPPTHPDSPPLTLTDLDSPLRSVPSTDLDLGPVTVTLKLQACVVCAAVTNSSRGSWPTTRSGPGMGGPALHYQVRTWWVGRGYLLATRRESLTSEALTVARKNVRSTQYTTKSHDILTEVNKVFPSHDTYGENKVLRYFNRLMKISKNVKYVFEQATAEESSGRKELIPFRLHFIYLQKVIRKK